MAGDYLDLSSDPPEQFATGSTGASERPDRRFLGVDFQCCRRYSRIYLNRQGTSYVGHCPGCGKRVEFTIGPGGSDSRFFTAY